MCINHLKIRHLIFIARFCNGSTHHVYKLRTSDIKSVTATLHHQKINSEAL
jgi:hypothetical protein